MLFEPTRFQLEQGFYYYPLSFSQFSPFLVLGLKINLGIHILLPFSSPDMFTLFPVLS
jgi:hypothetical protein